MRGERQPVLPERVIVRGEERPVRRVEPELRIDEPLAVGGLLLETEDGASVEDASLDEDDLEIGRSGDVIPLPR
jgi:hypothetical protein